MSESVRDLLVRGTAAARSGDEKEAKFFLEWMLDLDADLEQKIEAWYWLSKVTSDPKQKRNYLEDILANQPFHLLARRDLMIVDGKLDPNEIIDPNRIQLHQGANGERKAEVLSFSCPNCGGRMVYTPDGTALTCEYCESRGSMEQSFPSRISYCQWRPQPGTTSHLNRCRLNAKHAGFNFCCHQPLYPLPVRIVILPTWWTNLM
jgi:hypothetical protein